jgi:hypothetical protein
MTRIEVGAVILGERSKVSDCGDKPRRALF